MKRYYTEEAYNQIQQTIEQIDSIDVHPVKDFFSDLVMRLLQFLELYSVEQYRDDMQGWYDIILDSHNSTMSRVDNIFNAVDTVDFEYRDIMDGALDSIAGFQNTLNTLRDVVSGKISYADGKAAAAGYLSAGKDSLNSAYDTILTKMELQNLREANLELVKDTVALGATFAGYVIALGSGNPLKVAASVKKLSDAVTATFNDFAAIAYGVTAGLTVYVASKFGVKRKDLIDFRFDFLTKAQHFQETNSISDFLGGIADDMEEDLAVCPESAPLYPLAKFSAASSRFISDTSEGLDTLVDLYDIVSDVKDSCSTVDDWIHGKTFTSGELVEKYEFKKNLHIYEITDSPDGPIYRAKLPFSEVLSDLISDTTGIPLSGWDDAAKLDKNTWKTVGTIWSYTEKFFPDPMTGQVDTGELLDVTLEKCKYTKFAKDVFDFARENFDFGEAAVDTRRDYLIAEVT